MELDGYSRPTYNKLVHSATMRSTIIGAIHKLTVDEFVDLYTNDFTPTTCCGKIFWVHNVKITHVTPTTPT